METVEWSFQAVPDRTLDWAKDVEKAVLHYLRAHRLIDNKLADRIVDAHRELVANAIQASRKYGNLSITIVWEVTGGQLWLTVRNEGVRFVPTNRQLLFMPPADAEHGRGLPIVFRQTDAIHFRPIGDGTTILAIWRLKRHVH